MRQLFLTSVFITLASAAMAQQASPIVVIGEGAPVMAPTASDAAQQNVIQNFPSWAVTSVGANSSGQNENIPATPASPVAPAAPGADAIPAAPAAPQAPEVPKNPLTRAWPYDTVPLFMQSCVGYSPILTAPCACVITKLVNTMPHDEFMQLSAAGTIEQDPRLAEIRRECATKPQARK